MKSKSVTPKFINPFTDIGFKRIFGQEVSKPLIIDFLNLLLEGLEHIEDITFLDKEQPALFDDDRSLIYDIFCKTDTGKNIVVEMQNKAQPFFKNRSIYYVSEAIARQGERGPKWNYGITAVYMVAFMNFCPMDFERKFRTDVILADAETKAAFSDMVRLTYLQLPLFTKEAEECENDFERWIYTLRNMETLTRLPWAAKSAVFKKLEEIADVSKLSREEREKYDVGLRKYRDTISVLEGAHMDGFAEGRAEGEASGLKLGLAKGLKRGLAEGEAKGLERGRAEARAEKKMIARAMLAEGMNLNRIAMIMGLSAEDILS